MALEYINGLFVDPDFFQGHSITFGDGTLDEKGRFTGKNTWKDWHLIPSTRPTVAEAGPVTNFVDIPGRRLGPIDTTEYLTGGVVYGARSGSFEFQIANDYEYWESIRRHVVNYLHGKRMKMVLEDDPGWYFEGRFSVGGIKPGAVSSSITINYVLGPYKYYINAGGDWLWDPFNFETDYTDSTQKEEIL